MFLYLSNNFYSLKKNILGQSIFLKRIIIAVVGFITHKTFRSKNFEIIGSKNLIDLPDNNVLFVSNHQTYFYDVISMLHVFNSSVKGKIDSVKRPKYLFNPKTNLYFIAAVETMKNSFITKALAYAGAILIQRSWRDSGESISRELRSEDPSNINLALKDGWVITFPRGTTNNSKPVRKGTAHIIKNNSPIIVPIKLSVISLIDFSEKLDFNGSHISIEKDFFLFNTFSPFL